MILTTIVGTRLSKSVRTHTNRASSNAYYTTRETGFSPGWEDPLVPVFPTGTKFPGPHL